MYGDKNGPSKWTDEIDDLVRSNWVIGISATDCASIIYARFGVMFTRNAIIGRVQRKGYQTPTAKGYPGPRKDPNKPKTEKIKYIRRTIISKFGLPVIGLPVATVKQDKPMKSDRNTPKSRNLTLFDLPPHGCRYPTSPDDAATHLFCGAPQKEGLPYCSHHAGICYRATPRQMESKGPVLIACNAGDGAGI